MMEQQRTTGDASASSETKYYEAVLYKKVQGRLLLSHDSLSFQPGDSGSNKAVTLSWSSMVKHQVSPPSYPKSLMKIIMNKKGTAAAAGNNNTAVTFQLSSRPELERLRQDISQRLRLSQSTASSNGHDGLAVAGATNTTAATKKRPHADMTGAAARSSSMMTTHFGELDPSALAVTRSSLLASNPPLRAQHSYLVQETKTLDEHDFWQTHQGLLEDEYARISGMTKAGTSSLLQSHLQLLTGRVTLGVEEMRQIFILYPAVHKAYEEKVPLELSDEQFWRKYLESEYFHRDRGRIGAASRHHSDSSAAMAKKKKKGKNKLSVEDQEARAAAVGTDDIFSRYDQKIQEGHRQAQEAKGGPRKWGTNLAIGQFDLASTFETERGNLLQGPKDNFPDADDGKGAKVVQKYNRHWAMVMHPEDAVAGSDLMTVARRSVRDALPDDNDAKAGGGMDADMSKLVGFAMSAPEDANHALGIGLSTSEKYEPLSLKNIEVYYSGRPNVVQQLTPEEKEAKRIQDGVFAKTVVEKMNALVAATKAARKERRGSTLANVFPPLDSGKQLLTALTGRMEKDSRSDEDALQVVNSLPDAFKKKLHAYFRRTSELLRHFFGLRRLVEVKSTSYNQKLQKIVGGMETVYREMEEMRKGIASTGEATETMREMCLQIMEQLDLAFKLHAEGRGGGGGGGFVTIEEF